MVRGKKRCNASVCAIAIRMVIVMLGFESPCVWNRKFDLQQRNMARTYLFLHIMRLEPAACSGGTAVFFLVIDPNEGCVAQDMRNERAQLLRI